MALVTTSGARTVPLVNTMGTVPPSRNAPMAPQIQGYSGANPMRAYQGMAAATPRSSGAMSIGQLVGNVPGANPAPPRYPIEFVNPSQYQDPATKGSVSFLPGLSDAIGARAGSRPTINPNAPPLVSPPGQLGTPISNLPPKTASQLTPNLTPPTSSGVTGIGRAIQTAGSNHTISPKSGTAALAGNTLAGTTSPVAGGKAIPNFNTPAADASQKVTSPFTSGATSSTRTAPSGFLSYNAADPNRALRMMRGY